MDRSLFQVFQGDEKAIEHLTDAETGRLFRAMLSYSITGEVPDLRGNEKYVFSIMQYRIDKEIEETRNTVETNRANGAKGGRPKNRPVFKETEKTGRFFEEEKEKKKEERTKEERRKEKEEYSPLSCESVLRGRAREGGEKFDFVPPTVGEVKNYCDQCGYTIDAEKFVARYTAVGWMLGGNPVRDWKALVVCWVKRENVTPNQSAVSFDTEDFFEAACRRTHELADTSGERWAEPCQSKT